jgi:hypothetical protein
MLIKHTRDTSRTAKIHESGVISLHIEGQRWPWYSASFRSQPAALAWAAQRGYDCADNQTEREALSQAIDRLVSGYGDLS